MSSYFSQLISGKSKADVTQRQEQPNSPDVNVFGRSDDAIAQRRSFELDFVEKSGLFDASYYLAQYPDIAEAGVSPLEHFFDFGYKEGRKPNLYFDPQWYLTQNPDVLDANVHPLTHYASYGDIEGRRPSPIFDPFWYRKEYSLDKDSIALSHYLANRRKCSFSPIPDFDIEYYARNYPDVVSAQIDAFEHFISYGYQEGRTPSPHFDSRFYRTRYLAKDSTENPFLHFLVHKHEAGVFGRMPQDEASIPREIRRFTKAGQDFEEFTPLPASAPRRAKLLTYFLPQFHPFPENDEWWGKGFTEWTNVPRGLPRFKGHYQPRVPRDLGFYSLNDAETIRRQVEMAKAGGVYGFVFYYYWFNGKRLLDKPLDALVIDKTISMPFCLMWANENWTRRWDGADTEVLISQDYRQEDELLLAADLVRYFEDSRYIRLQGRPLLMLYRPSLITEAKATITRLRNLFKDNFDVDPLLVMGQTFNAIDPAVFGMDGAIEFPPHKLTQDLPSINTTLHYLDIEFEGKAYRYDDVVKVSLNEPPSSFPLIKTAVPSWDNDARRQGNGLVLTESTPHKYQAWLSELVDRAVQNPFFGEPIVCVNAWNEWCEAAYLEPDLHFGSAYLNATARAIVGKSQQTSDGRVILVGHDCFPSGAQHLLLNIGRVLRANFGAEISVLLLEGGKLEKAYRELGEVNIVASQSALEAHIWRLKENRYTSAIVNTSAAASAVPILRQAVIDVTLLIHELPRILRQKGLSSKARAAAVSASRIIFPATYVREQFCEELKIPQRPEMLIIPQGMYHRIEISQASRNRVRKELKVLKGHRLVLGVGYADLRKGFDLFLQVWRIVKSTDSAINHFCWIGDIDPDLKDFMKHELADAVETGTFHLPGYSKDVSSFLSAADAFVLTSREDPFPSVVLEALYAGLSTVAFERSGGIPDLLRSSPLGQVVPFADTVAMANSLVSTFDKGTSHELKAISKELITKEYNFETYVWQLFQLAHRGIPIVSVAVPNYNYARHLPGRLSSIFLQTQPVKEILVLDDCSTDNSLEVVPVIAKEWQRQIRLLPNRSNSGSVFRQWRKAAENTCGEFLWIAEADDISSTAFLSEVLSLMRYDSSVHFAFSDSKSVDSTGIAIWPNYKGYYATVGPDSLTKTEIFDARSFASRFMSVKNLILNVSAVVWRRKALLDAMDACESELKQFKMAGDWRLYLQALSCDGASIGYCSDPHNTHRRHSGSVTHALNADIHLAEIKACHKFAGVAFQLDSTTVAAQELYTLEVSRQLGATEIPKATVKADRKRKSAATLQ